jgi:hypothetical protein
MSAQTAQPTKKVPEPPKQPIAYSHKQHLALGLKCKECHVQPDPGDMMTFPASSKCMACHNTIAKDKPEIQKLAAFAKSGEIIPWVRVYKIPEWVDFSHKSHLDAGAKCENCHGAVAQRDAIYKEVETSMAACMDCHRQHNARVECNFCHDER